MILLHAVTRRLGDDTETGGLLVHRGPSVSVLFTESDPPPPSTAAVLAHGRRITALAERLTLLPMRWGTTVDSVTDLAALVAEREDEWARRLDAVEGHRELLVHVPESTGVGAGRATTGREYLRRRTDALHQQDRVWAAVADAVAPYAREHRRLPDGRRMAALVPPEREPVVRSAVATLARREQLAITVTGPWPPFSFCEERPPDG